MAGLEVSQANMDWLSLLLSLRHNIENSNPNRVSNKDLELATDQTL